MKTVDCILDLLSSIPYETAFFTDAASLVYSYIISVTSSTAREKHNSSYSMFDV